MLKLAIIGTGIAGLGCAHFLQSRFDLTLFEQADYPGGHTNTIAVPERAGSHLCGQRLWRGGDAHAG